MKANPLACALLVLLAVAFQLPAQQPVSSSGTNAPVAIPDWAKEDSAQQPVTSSGTNRLASKLPVVSVTNPDGSVIK